MTVSLVTEPFVIGPTIWNIVDWFGTWHNDDDSTRGGALPRYCRKWTVEKPAPKQAPKAQKGDRGIMVRGRMGG